MDKQLFENETPKRRLELLEGMADSVVQEHTYMKPLSESEMLYHKDRLPQTAIELAKLTDKLNEAKKAFKEAAKPHQQNYSESLNAIKLKHEEATGKAFVIVDRENKMTGTYNELGQLINARPMLENESIQLGIVGKTGTNN